MTRQKNTAKSPLRLFLRELANNPRQMGTVWPSSSRLAEAMVRRLPADHEFPILELGPGTGVVTEQLIASGWPEHRLVALEKSELLATHLRKRFTRARIINGDALELDRILDGTRVGAVFSSLPLKVFTPRQVERLSAAIESVSIPGAPWVQYTYQLLDGHPPAASFRAVASEIVWRNLPPAKVSVYCSVSKHR